MTEKEIKRRKLSRQARERRRRRRKRIVMAERIAIAVFLIGGLGGGAALLWNFMPDIRIAKRLQAAGEYVETKAYEDAIASCEEALEIDSQSVKAYRAMAGVYLTQEDRESAEQVLYRGWESTQDEGLLQEYCVHLLNDAVEDVNTQSCTLDTFEKCVKAIETDQANADGYKLLGVCYGYLFSDDAPSVFCSDAGEGGCCFDRYLDLMKRMLALYETSPSQELKREILRYGVPANSLVELEVKHLADYRELLAQIAALDEEKKTADLSACLEKAAWAQEVFAEAFGIFESGDFMPVKEFMQSQTYIGIRDQFIDGTMEYWEGKTYIPVSREKMKLMQEDGQWKFAFCDFEDVPETAGVINVWGAKQEDDGVQRLCISYEPASEGGEYYPHTIYEFVYLYSNVKVGGAYVPQMNYRFETRVATPEGTSSQLIGDWGGEHQWDMEY